MTTDPTPNPPDANEADALEQKAPIEDRPPLDTSKLEDRNVEADEADLFESAQTIPAADEEEHR